MTLTDRRTARDRVKVWRQQKRARGTCLRCSTPTDHGHSECRRCRLTLAPIRAALMRRLRASIDFWHSHGWPIA